MKKKAGVIENSDTGLTSDQRERAFLFKKKISRGECVFLLDDEPKHTSKLARTVSSPKGE